jgi:hypothetical protein
MGTGSAGGGGGGSGGGGGGGGSRARGLVSYSFQDGIASGTEITQHDIRQEISNLLRERASAVFLKKQFSSALVAGIYRHLMDLALARAADDPLDHLARSLQVDPGPGFLVRLADAIVSADAGTESDQRIRETARVCLDDFLVLATGNDLDIYTSATQQQVRQHLDRAVLESTLGHFLASLIVRVAERQEIERLSASAQVQLQDDAQRRADHAIARYQQRFSAGDQPARYRDFFEHAQADPDWLLREISS